MEQKPLIHLLRSPGGYYFYETNRNEIVSTSKEAYELLEQVMNPMQEDISDLMAHPLLCEIRGLGYLSSNRPQVIEHPMTEHMADYLERKLGKITLQVTQDCNLRCKYCSYSAPAEGQQRAHTARYMSWDVAKKALDFALAHSRDSEDINIGFYGGEPLLARELIQKAVTYAKEIFLGKKLSFSMTSNGTLLSDEVVAFCQEHDMMLMISLDGPQEIHDKNRVMMDGSGSFSVIVENVQRIRKHYPEYYQKIMFNMVVDPQNDYDCSNRIFLDYPMFDKNRMQSSLMDDQYLANKVDIAESFGVKNEYNQFLSFLHKADIISNTHVLPLSLGYTDKIAGKLERTKKMSMLPKKIAPGGPCLPGVLRAMVDVDGKLFPCERCSELSSVMTIGTIEEGFVIPKAQELLNVGALTAEACRNCWALLHCNCCASQIEDGETLSAEKKLGKCDGIRYRTEYEFRVIAMLYELSRLKYGAQDSAVTVLGGVT